MAAFVGSLCEQDDEAFADAWATVVKKKGGHGPREAGGGPAGTKLQLARQPTKEQVATAQFVEKFKADKAASERCVHAGRSGGWGWWWG